MHINNNNDDKFSFVNFSTKCDEILLERQNVFISVRAKCNCSTIVSVQTITKEDFFKLIKSNQSRKYHKSKQKK